MIDPRFPKISLAVLLPCYNEAQSIASVVTDFRLALPSARIFVYDNNSTDATAAEAASAGAVVVPAPRQGKGNVVRQMFSDIEADIFVMADGDGTYDPAAAPEMVEKLLDGRLDMVVGVRRDVTIDAGRKGHAFGNRLFNKVYKSIFGNDFTDIFSGYRVFTRRFAKSFPAQSPGFEIETEMSVHASTLRLPVAEMPFDYGRRAEGSASKLSTFRDGVRILRMIFMLMKETRPFIFFSYFAIALLAGSLFFMAPVVREYLTTGLVSQLPKWVFASTLLLGAMMTFIAGVVLDSVARGRAEQKRFHYMAVSPARGEQYGGEAVIMHDRRDRFAAPGAPNDRETAA